MAITAKMKIIGKNPRIGEIISKFAVYEWGILEEGKDYKVIGVTMPTREGLNQLKRRLGGKRRRKARVFEVGGEKEENELR